jgi:hypothetical protein
MSGYGVGNLKDIFPWQTRGGYYSGYIMKLRTTLVCFAHTYLRYIFYSFIIIFYLRECPVCVTLLLM